MDDLVALSAEHDIDRVLGLCIRAEDYIRLETGSDPNASYVNNLLTDAPPDLPDDHVFCLGHTQADGTLDAFVTFLKGHYAPGEWYMGLLLLDPTARGKGLGARMAQHVVSLARADGGTCIRVAVLDINPGGLAFWKRQGFEIEKSVTPEDGLLRRVHRLPL